MFYMFYLFYMDKILRLIVHAEHLGILHYTYTAKLPLFVTECSYTYILTKMNDSRK